MTPNTTFKAILYIKLIEERNALFEEDISKSFIEIEQNLTFFARTCILGEIKTVDNSCYECPFGFFSLRHHFSSDSYNGIQKCIACLEHAECQGSMLTPLEGFWRSSSTSTLIIR